MIHKPELLAPAGNMASLIAAVENGADAVYLGVRDFSARAYAGNFTMEDFREALDYAHLRGVKVYVTLNTLIKDTEFEKAVNLMQLLDELGTDAIIVQDIGLLSLARRFVPELPVHASTQMTIHNTEGVRFLQDMGMSRVVLAREMSLDEIRTLRQDTGMEIEVFIHGALCICYSGQCLMSSMIGGRSGNRGHCAQPCRKRYSLMKGSMGLSTRGCFLLSPKDLNTSAILPELMKAGIASFKIEGRMKRPEYVAGVVRIYRHLIDRYSEDPEGYFVSDEENAQLAQLFNREFTTGYFKGNPAGSLMSRERPYNRGVPAGRVMGYDRKGRNLTLELTEILRTGDGIGFEGEEDSGTVVQAMYSGGKPVREAAKGAVVSMPFDIPLRAGTRIYRTLDSSLMKELQGSFETSGTYRKVSVRLKAEAFVGKPFSVTLQDEDGNTASAVSDYIIEAALKKATERENIQRQMEKLGNTVFEARLIDIDMGDDGLFIPIREMNEARNKAAAGLERLRTEGRRRKSHPAYTPLIEASAPPATGKPLLAVSFGTKEKLQQAISGGADILYYDPELSVTNIETGLEDIVAHAREAEVPVYLHTPLIVKDQGIRDLEHTMVAANEAGFEGVIAANMGVLRMALARGISTIADSSLNIFNRQAASFLSERGAEMLVLSPEMNFEQIKEVSSGIATECIVHGRLKVMESEHCLVAALTGPGALPAADTRGDVFSLRDERGFSFPVTTNIKGRTSVFNSKELCLLEDIPKLIDAGVSRLRVDVRMTGVEATGQLVKAYRDAIDSYYYKRQAGSRKCRDFGADFTRGHYHRGVL
ncbi:MAG: family peptidase [Methanolobus sp.]|nr:family peptidase [Methanolobus sp.]MDK2912381.1 family peptidase [Methanolobus sp.]